MRNRGVFKRNVPPKGKRKTIGGIKEVKKWLVSVDYPYYPFVMEFDTYEEAVKSYNYNLEQAKEEESFTHNVYLAEVKKEYKNGITN